jgi:hypothetical protein
MNSLSRRNKQSGRASTPRPTSSPGYFVAQGAVLLACLRYWAQIEGKTDADVQAAIASADKGTLEKAVREHAADFGA